MSIPTRTHHTVSTAPAVARAGVLAGHAAAPLFLGVWLGQALVRPGYDLTRHPMSLLALGDGGWVQVADFVLTGLLVLALAGAYRLLLRAGTGRRAVPVLVAVMGLGLVAAGLFPTDAGAGFPAGAPEGMPVLTPTGVVHQLAHAVVMGAYTAVTVVLVVRFRRHGARRTSWVVLGVLGLVVVLSAIPHLDSFPVRTALAGALPLAFLAALAHREATAGRRG